MYSAGTAYLSVVPSFRGVEKAFAAEAAKLGKLVESAIGQGMRDGASGAQGAGHDAGDEFGKAFGDQVKKHLDEAVKNAGKIKVDADTGPFERAMAKVREDLALLRDVRINLHLSADEFFAEIERVKRELQDLDHKRVTIELRTNAAKVLAELRAVEAMRHKIDGGGPVAADPAGGGAAGGVHVDTSQARAQVAALNGLLDALNKRTVRIAVDIDAAKALGNMRLLSGQIDLMNRKKIEIPVKLDTAGALAEMRSFQSLMTSLNARKVKVAVDLDTGKAIANLQKLNAALTAFGSTKRISIDLDAGKALADAAELRRQLDRLARMTIRIGVKVDTLGALAEINKLSAQIDRVSKKTISINVKINAGTSMATLVALDRLISRIDGRTITVHVNLNGVAAAMAALTALNMMVNHLQRQNIRLGVGAPGAAAAAAGANATAAATSAIGDAADFSIGRMGALIAVGASLGTALVPAAAAAAASISAIATAAAAAVAGVGVFALGIFGVVKAVGAMDKAQKDQAKANKSYGQSENQVANAIDGVRDAHESQARTRDEVARGARRAARTVADAQQTVIDAEKDALKAEQELLRAKQEAQRQDEDRAMSLKENALAQRQATLDIADAKKELDAVLNNPRATQAEKEQAKINYEERLLQMDKLKTENKRMEEDRAREAKQGSDVVVAAQQRVTDANKSVAKAQQSLADAFVAQREQQIDGNRQLIDAQQAVVRSQRALQQAYVSSATAGGAAMQDLQQAMAGLSPAGQKFAKFLFGLKGSFTELQHSAEEGMLPGLQKAIEMLVPYFPAIRDFTFNVAKALGDTFVGLAQTLQDPVWQRWFSYIGATAAPTLKGMAQFVSNVATGLFGLLNSLSGFNGPIGAGLLKWSEMFRTWGSNLDKNKGFQAFLAYVRDSAPKVLELLRQAWILITHIVEAAAPIGTVVVEVFTKLFGWINKIPIDVLIVLVATISGVAVAFLAFAGIAALVASPVGLIILAIAALVAGFAILYVKVKPFRDFINALAQDIAAEYVWLWKNAIKPAVEGIVWLWQNALAPAAVWLWKNAIKPAAEGIAWLWLNVIAPAAVWLWKNVIAPAFQAIGAIVMFLWNYVIKPAFQAIAWLITNVLAPVFSWLYDHILQPMFTGWVVLIKVVWAILQVIFGLIMIAVKLVGWTFMEIWKLFLKPFWDLIVMGAKATWEFLKPFFDWLAKVWSKDIAPALADFGALLGKIWDGFISTVKIAVKFVVDTVLNDGLLAGYNWLAQKFGVKPDDVHISLPGSFDQSPKTSTAPAQTGGRNNTHFAAGGYISGPGGPRDDKISAWLSNGEYVIPAHIVSSMGVGFFDQLTGRQTPGSNHTKPGQIYADGGLVSFMKSAWDTLTNPIDWLKEQAEKLLSGIPGGPWLKDTMVGMGHKTIDGVVQAVRNMLSTASSAGGDGASVAGIVGDPNVVFPPWPASPSASRGDSGVWRNVVALIKSTGPLSGEFGNSYRPGDPLWHGSGRAVDWMGFNQDALASFLATRRPLELIHRTPKRDYAYTRGVDKGSFHEELMQEHKNHVHIAMDNGGMLPLGWSEIYNGTGKPEPVLTGGQWRAMGDYVNAAHTSSAQNVYNFANTTLDESQLRAHDDREAAKARIGRAR